MSELSKREPDYTVLDSKPQYDLAAHIERYRGGELRSRVWPPSDDGWDLVYLDLGYSWCRPCKEYHRLPECNLEGEVIA